MKFYVGLFVLLNSAFSFAGERTGTYPSTYHTPLLKVDSATCTSDSVKPVHTAEGKILTSLCPDQYTKCMFYGSCIIENSSGERLGVSFYKYDSTLNLAYFVKTEDRCQFGYGFGKVNSTQAGSTCLIPYVSVAADPTEHTLGEVLFLPSLVGVSLPDGQIHDGYVIVGDYAKDQRGSGFDNYIFFTGTQSKSDPQNPFKKIGLTNPDSSFKYQTTDETKAHEIRKKHNFDVFRIHKRTFSVPSNPMIGAK